jgi:hypothetical protein
VLGAFIVVASLAYLCLLLASALSRQAVDNRLNQYIQRGEVAVMKMQNAK